MQAGRARNEQRKKAGLINQQAAEDEQWFNRQYYQDLSQRTEIQDQLRQLRETLNTERERDEAQADIAGSTFEQRLARADSRNKAISNTMAGVMRNASSLRDNWMLQRLQNKHNTTAQMLGMQDNLTDIYNKWAGNLSTSAAGAMQAGSAMLGHGLADTTPQSNDMIGRAQPSQTGLNVSQSPNAEDILNSGLDAIRARNKW